MAQQQINVNLAFTANTEAAKQSLQQLQQQLQQIATKPVSVGEKLTPQLQAASRAAAELQAHLSNATNVKTGNLDFGKLTQSIKQSGMSLSEYGAKLQNIGPQGQQAFMSLAQSVAMAEVPMRRAGTALTGMLTTLKNTAKWQLSSSLLHGFISSVSSAYNYAQDLNESLNNIRIVTGYNIDQMSKFAAEANKAARALSTTTTEYTNASLIYYQQGLSDADVKARTDVTIKMANASRQSAEIVSDQLTAIWNNFDNGTKSLEYYADVITALGAATASSSEEISDGLEKFAAVAETVGLSYEYATAALATVTATTRQSADVVGTAFKTLFARLNDLKLGETLDDGTTLGQYTENLAKIGVNIKDTSGQLKDMDQILTETAAKWDQLGRDQQVALAKGIAGIRQYSQFIALMDNWDFMEENLRTVESSGGTLQKQADIYAESWEAAQERVRAAAEKVYSSLLNDKFFIALTNGFGDLIDTVGSFVDSIGGLGGVLSTFGAIITKVFATQMADGFRNLVYNIQMSTKAGQYAVQQAKELEMTKFAGMMAKGEASTAAEIQTKKVYEQELILQKELIANADKMTESEQRTYQTLLEQHRIMGQQSIELQKQIELLKNQAADQSLEVIGSGMLKGTSYEKMADGMSKVRASATGLREVQAIFQQIGTEGNDAEVSIKKIETVLTNIGMSKKEINGLAPTFNKLKAGGDDAAQAMEKLQAIIVRINKSKIKDTIVNVAGVREGTKEYQRLEKILMSYSETIGAVRKHELELEQTNENLKESFTSLRAGLQSAGVNIQDWATHLSTVMSSLMSVGMLISSVKGLIDTINNPDLTGWERVGAIFTSVSMIAMALTGTLKGLGAGVQLVGEIFKKDTLIKTANTLAAYLQEKASKKVGTAKGKEALTTKTSTEATKKDTVAKIENTGAIKLNEGALKTLGIAALKTIGILAILAASALIIKTVSDSFHEAEWAAEDAANAAGQLRNRYVELQQAYSEFDGTVDKYKEAIKKTEELTKGTDEYKEALLNANSQALELIKKYNLINDYSITGGVITINDAALERAKQQQLIDVGNAQAAANLGAVTASYYSRKSQVNNTARDLNTIGDFQQHAGNIIGTGVAGAGIGVVAGLGTAAMAAKIGGAIGTAITPGIGTAIGAAIGGLAGLITGAVITNENGVENASETEALDVLLKYTKEYGTDIFGAKTVDQFRKMLDKANLKIDDDSVITAILQNSQAVKDLTVAELARLENEGVDWREAFNNYNMVNSPEYANLQVGQGYLQYQSELHRNKNIDDVRQEVDNMSKTEVYTKYLQLIEGQKNAAGLVGESVKIADEDWSDASIYDLKDNVWTLRGDKEGLSLDIVKNLVTEAMLLQDASAAMNFDTLSRLTKELESAGLTLEDNAAIMDQALSNYGGEKLIDFSNFTASEILNIDTSKILDKDFRNAMDKAVNDYKNNMTAIQREIVNSDWYKGLTPEEQDVVWTIDIDENDSLEEVQKNYEQMQDWLNANNLIAGLTIASDLTGLLEKEQKAKTDWETIKTKYNELAKKNDNAMAWEDFIKLSQSKQVEYVKLLESGMSQTAQTTTFDAVQSTEEKATNVESAVGSAKNDYEIAKNKAEDATKKYENAKTEFEQANQFNPISYKTEKGFSTQVLQTENGQYNWNVLGEQIVNSDFLHSGLEGVFTNILTNAQELIDGSLSNMAYDEFYNLYNQNSAAINTDLETLADMYGYEGKEKDTFLYQMKSMFLPSFDALFKGNTANTFTSFGINYPGFNTFMSLLATGYNSHYRTQVTSYAEESATANKEMASAGQSYSNAVTNNATAQEDLEKAYQNYQYAIDKQESLITAEGFDLKEIKAIGEALAETNVELKENEYLTNELAKSMMRYERAVKTGIANYDTWKKTLQSGDLIDQIRTINELKTSYGDLLDIDGSLLGQEFLKDTTNLELYNSAINGSKEAYSQFQQKAFEEIYTSQIGTMPDDIKNILAEIDNLDSVKIGDKVVIGESTLATDLENIYITAVKAAIDGGAKVEEAMNIANNLIATKGFDAQVEMVTTEVTHTGQLPTGWTAVEGGGITGPDGEKMPNVKWTAVDGDKYTYTQTFTTPKPISFTKSTENVGGGGSSGSTGTKKSPAENKKYSSLKKKSDVVERYKELDDALDDVADAMEDVNKQADRLYGANRINALKKQNELLKQQRELLKSKKTDAETNLTSDKNSLLNIASKHGVNFEFNDKGHVTNYTAEMTKLFEELHKVEEYWAKASNFSNSQAQSDYEKNKVQPIRDKIDEIKDALGIYTNTRELIEDLQKAIDDAFYEWQDNNYEQLHYKLELQLDINDNELRMIDYYLNKISDDFYSMAEAAQFMFDKLTPIQGSLESYKAFKESLDDAYLDGAGEISQADYIDGLKESYEGILNNLEALQDLDKQMMHYYEDTLAAGMEELAQYTDHMEHLTGVLDHYHNLITMINGEEDYESIDTVLRGKATTLKNEVDVAASNYEMLKREQAAIQASYNNAVDENARELFANELKAINAQVDEAHETLLSKTEEWAEVQKVIMENVMKKAAHEMEQAFTSGLGFDTLSNSIERLSSLSDEYLTKTNQIYETQKLINTAQQASDNTTNNAAKIRLKNFQDEIAALQEKNKLTKLDLDIAKAKYDVLLAEIALEEAQNAKATVRLQRDNEGNYGYVYTADQQKVAEAEQNLADTQNALYNVRLEAANNYGQKIMELNQKLYDDMAALEQAYMVDGTISEEEYNQQKEMLLREYYDLYEVYSHNYTTAMEEDAAIQTDAWVTAYEDIINSADQWQQHINIYSQACEDAYQHYRSVVEFESDIINDLLSDVAGSVKEVTTESDTLKNKVIGEVIPSLESQLGQVRAVTSAYAAQRTSILELMTAYEDLAESILEVMRAESMRAGAQVGPPEDFGGTEPQGTQSEGSGSPAQSKAARVQQLIKAVNAGAVSLSEQGWAPSAKSHGYSEEEIALARQAFTQSRETLKTSDPTAYAASVYNYDYYAALGIASRFKSGGYTGAWGPEGRMAILDEKELVLNARDTENFLMATGILRSISDVIDINSLHNQISQLSSISMTAADRGMLEQQVSIEAHFPNVSDRNEIEEAFNNLINTASQYANRKF